MSLRLGFIGLGALGTPIAQHIVAYAKEQDLPPVSFWNRSKDKYDAIKEVTPDAYYAESVEELAERCDVIHTVLLNDAVAEEVVGKLVNARKEGGLIVVDHSTLLPETCKKLESLASSSGSTYLTCPVFGQPAAAKARQLIVMASGDPTGIEKVKGVLDHIGKKTIVVGEDVTKGSQIKLLGNMTLLSLIQLLGEVYTLAENIGFDSEVLHELYKSFLPAPPLLVYSNKISHGTFGGAGFQLNTGLKDANHILSLREALSHPVPLPTLEKAVENLKKAQAEGRGELDWSSLTTIIRTESGLAPFKEGTEEGKKVPPPL